MAVPWMPREIAFRLLRPHEEEHLRSSYALSTAYVGGYLGRDDGQRPAWFMRVHLMPVRSLAPDMQEHLASVCRVICMKVRQEVTSEPAALNTSPDRPQTAWQAGMLCARVLWRTLFASAAAKFQVAKEATPLLFMIACESQVRASRRLLVRVWNEMQLQFTARVNNYRNVKSRPKWIVLEELQSRVFGDEGGIGLEDPKEKPQTNAGTKPAAGLQDFMEEVLALRFAVDFLTASAQDAQAFLEQATRRKRYAKQPAKPRGDKVERQLAELREKSVDSFAMMWTDDAELRGVASVAARIMDGLEGPQGGPMAATVVGQLLLAMWKGLHPLLEHYARAGIARIAESQAQAGTLPPPQLQEQDNDFSHTSVFDRIATSYGRPSEECLELCTALPRGVVGSLVKVQATWRGYVFRARHFARARTIATYCKAVEWPLQQPRHKDFDTSDGAGDKKRKQKKSKKVDAATLNDTITDFKPNVSQYLGGEKAEAPKPTLGASLSGSKSMPRLGASGNDTSVMSSSMHQPAPLQIRITADHKACADLFALYMFNMYRRKKLVSMWQTLCVAYERGMDVFAELLNKNPALKPMLDSIAAQLKRGSVVGYDKAFIAKQKKGEVATPGRIRPADAELFRRAPRPEGAMSQSQSAPALPSQDGKPPLAGSDPARDSARNKQLKASASAAGMPRADDVEVSGEYLANYLKEMDGDDSQFKDISPAVVPLSTGTSPSRSPPHEYILKEAQKASTPDADASGALADDGGQHMASLEAAEAKAVSGSGRGMSKPSKPKLDVPFCLQRVKPLWLPIKAHRWAAYRAKVLHMLPKAVLQQYIDFERQQHYAACVKLLESATPGSLNVLSPATLVANKPLEVETVMQLIVGYSGLCLKQNQGTVAVKLITQVLDNMSLALRDMHPGHRLVMEAYLYDVALTVCYYMPMDISLSDRAESFYQQASERYLRLNHTNRYCKCCLRAAAVLHGQRRFSEAEYYTQQALNKLMDAPVSSLLAVTYHNLATHSVVQHRIADSTAHTRSFVALLRQLPRLSNSWMQLMDNSQWLILKTQELWPQYQQQANLRDSQAVGRQAWA